MRRLRAQLLFGPSVHPVDLPRLRQAGVTAILSLQQPGIDLPQTAIERMRVACEPGIGFFNVGIHDYDPLAMIETMPIALRCLAELLDDGRIVYVHCTEGVNRAPSLALAHLVLHDGLDIDRALSELRRCDAGAKPYEALVQWLRSTTRST